MNLTGEGGGQHDGGGTQWAKHVCVGARACSVHVGKSPLHFCGLISYHSIRKYFKYSN